MIGVLGHLVLLSVGYVASLFFATPEKSYRAMTLWGWLESRKLKKTTQTTGAATAEFPYEFAAGIPSPPLEERARERRPSVS